MTRGKWRKLAVVPRSPSKRWRRGREHPPGAPGPVHMTALTVQPATPSSCGARRVQGSRCATPVDRGPAVTALAAVTGHYRESTMAAP